jgi:hypothetical protein
MDGHMWLRHTPEAFGTENITIYEPCNYVSNLAYYHSTVRTCDYPEFNSGLEYQTAIKRSFASLAVGSAMWHGTFTYVGASFDNRMISVIAYLAHQMTTENIPCTGKCNENIFKGLGHTKRTVTAVEFSE